jgi:hypothetical protein
MSRGTNSQKRTQWLDRLDRFAESNLSVAEFCRQEQVSVASFYQWRRKLAETTFQVDGRRQSPTFLPVHVAGPADLEVNFPNGARLTLPLHHRDLVPTIIASIAMAQTTQGGA